MRGGMDCVEGGMDGRGGGLRVAWMLRAQQAKRHGWIWASAEAMTEISVDPGGGEWGRGTPSCSSPSWSDVPVLS